MTTPDPRAEAEAALAADGPGKIRPAETRVRKALRALLAEQVSQPPAPITDEMIEAAECCMNCYGPCRAPHTRKDGEPMTTPDPRAVIQERLESTLAGLPERSRQSADGDVRVPLWAVRSLLASTAQPTPSDDREAIVHEVWLDASAHISGKGILFQTDDLFAMLRAAVDAARRVPTPPTDRDVYHVSTPAGMFYHGPNYEGAVAFARKYGGTPPTHERSLPDGH